MHYILSYNYSVCSVCVCVCNLFLIHVNTHNLIVLF